MEESGRSSATLGTASAEEWLQQAAREGENDGDSPASRLQYQLMQGALHCKHPAEAAVQMLIRTGLHLPSQGATVLGNSLYPGCHSKV